MISFVDAQRPQKIEINSWLRKSQTNLNRFHFCRFKISNADFNYSHKMEENLIKIGSDNSLIIRMIYPINGKKENWLHWTRELFDFEWLNTPSFNFINIVRNSANVNAFYESFFLLSEKVSFSVCFIPFSWQKYTILTKNDWESILLLEKLFQYFFRAYLWKTSQETLIENRIHLQSHLKWSKVEIFSWQICLSWNACESLNANNAVECIFKLRCEWIHNHRLWSVLVA